MSQGREVLLVIVVLGLVFLLCIMSYLDIRYRKENNRWIIIFLGWLVLSLWTTGHFYLLSDNILLSAGVIVAGIVLSACNLLGGADSKLLAVILLGILPPLRSAFGVCLAVAVLIVAVIFWLAVLFLNVPKSRGVPLIPAIAASGMMFIVLSIMD